MTTDATQRHQDGATTVREFLAVDARGRQYRAFECLRCGDEWTGDTPGPNICTTCR